MTTPRANATHVVRDWLRTLTSLVAHTGTVDNIATGKLPGVGACVVLYRAGGGPDATGGMDVPNIAADCWSADSETEAWNMAGIIVAAAEEVAHVQVAGAILDGVNILSVLWQPDDQDRPRYVVTMQATIRSV